MVRKTRGCGILIVIIAFVQVLDIKSKRCEVDRKSQEFWSVDMLSVHRFLRKTSPMLKQWMGIRSAGKSSSRYRLELMIPRLSLSYNKSNKKKKLFRWYDSLWSGLEIWNAEVMCLRVFLSELPLMNVYIYCVGLLSPKCIWCFHKCSHPFFSFFSDISTLHMTKQSTTVCENVLNANTRNSICSEEIVMVFYWNYTLLLFFSGW